MKIAVLCYETNELDIITTEKLDDNCDSREVEDYLQNECNYNLDTIHYLADVSQVNELDYLSFSK